MICVKEGKVAKTLAPYPNYDAIIVLGAQVKPDRTLSVQLTWRMDAAAEAYVKKPVPIVVCGAQGPDEPCTEAEAMKEYLLGKGVPGELILTDPESFNTSENLENARHLLEAYPDVKRVLIVTSDYHVPLGCLLFSEQFIFTSYATGLDLISVTANAGYKAKNPLPYNPANEAPDVWAVFDAFSNGQ